MVVDEAVLAISGRHHADPLEPFYRTVENGTRLASSLELVRDGAEHVVDHPGFDRRTSIRHARSHLRHGEWLRDGQRSRRARTVGHGSGVAAIKSRKDFRATAVWSPRLVTDAPATRA